MAHLPGVGLTGSVGLLQAERPDGAGDQRRDREQHERGKDATDQREAELDRQRAGPLLGLTPTIETGFVGEEVERGGQWRAVALGAADRGDDGANRVAGRLHESGEGVGQALAPSQPPVDPGQGRAERRRREGGEMAYSQRGCEPGADGDDEEVDDVGPSGDDRLAGATAPAGSEPSSSTKDGDGGDGGEG